MLGGIQIESAASRESVEHQRRVLQGGGVDLAWLRAEARGGSLTAAAVRGEGLGGARTGSRGRGAAVAAALDGSGGVRKPKIKTLN